MLVSNKNYKSIWCEGSSIKIIDQTLLPFNFKIIELKTSDDFVDAIVNMKVRGAPLIGVTALFGVANEMRVDPGDKSLNQVINKLSETRPTAYNLFWALNEIKDFLNNVPKNSRYKEGMLFAQQKSDEDISRNKLIGSHCGEEILKNTSKKTINVLTHCNAGWLATVDYGTALAPIFFLKEKNINVHVYVSETRPRNQGGFLTAWELENMKIPHTVIADNASGLIIQKGMIDFVIVGSDRIIHSGEVFNKIGTYMKALACKESSIPFYVCAPTSTIDWEDETRGQGVVIEERDSSEVSEIMGFNTKSDGICTSRIINNNSPAINPAFDMTPTHFVSKIFTAKGGSLATELYKQKYD